VERKALVMETVEEIETLKALGEKKQSGMSYWRRL
jgi:hypothetical protein